MIVAAGLKANFGRDSEIAVYTIGVAVVSPISVEDNHQIQVCFPSLAQHQLQLIPAYCLSNRAIRPYFKNPSSTEAMQCLTSLCAKGFRTLLGLIGTFGRCMEFSTQSLSSADHWPATVFTDIIPITDKED